MILSEKYKYIYIAVPKTGTTSVQKFLIEHDNSAVKNKVIVDGQEMFVPGHATALDIKNIMGKSYNDYSKIAFIRNPLSKLVSSYFFYRKGGKKDMGVNIGLRGEVMKFIAKILPFTIWSILYPYRDNMSHLLDNDGNSLVDFIGDFENLSEGIEMFFINQGVHFGDHGLSVINASKHSKVETYYKNKFHKKLINLKLRKDIAFYKSVHLLNIKKNIG